MKPAVDKAVVDLLHAKLNELEKSFNSDVLSYFGPIIDGNENNLLNIVEDLARDKDKNNSISVILTTGGGRATRLRTSKRAYNCVVKKMAGKI